TAHQAHNIPWHLLASNLEWKTPTPNDNFATNFYPRMKPNQANDLNHFVQNFVENLGDHTACGRKKYPDRYRVLEPADMILDEDLVRKISLTVCRWRYNSYWPLHRDFPSDECRGSDFSRDRSGFNICKCNFIPREERLMAASLREPENQVYSSHTRANSAAYFNAQIVQTLLIYGEMDPILRICGYPNVHLEFWCYGWFFRGFYLPSKPNLILCHADFKRRSHLRWEPICRQMLQAYICLNVTYCFPEHWNSGSRKTKQNDYGDAQFYQKTLANCGTSILPDLLTYPHAQFFAMEGSSRTCLQICRKQSMGFLKKNGTY
ncbi:hypothetical protein N7478_001750, partial [Penicillium angulare]|uniref:uncharacterized protein n=1 Tax=Penicillium angulare TaxID=116970 RepID=UPI00253F78A9